MILLSDKQLSESYLSIDKSKLNTEVINRGKKVEKSDSENDTYKRYEYILDGISPYSTPGVEKTHFIATSYEHDEYGATNEEPTTKGKMTEKRVEKLITFVKNEFNENFYGYEIINPEAENFYITMGINRYALEATIRGKSDFGLIIVKSLYPFDPRLQEFLESKKEKIKSLIFDCEFNFDVSIGFSLKFARRTENEVRFLLITTKELMVIFNCSSYFT